MRIIIAFFVLIVGIFVGWYFVGGGKSLLSVSKQTTTPINTSIDKAVEPTSVPAGTYQYTEQKGTHVKTSGEEETKGGVSPHTQSLDPNTKSMY